MAEILDNFNSLSQWQTAGGALVVSSNRVSGNGATNGDAWIDLTTTAVFRMEFYVTPSTPDTGSLHCGWSTATQGSGTPGASTYRAIIYDASAGRFVYYNGPNGAVTEIKPASEVVKDGTTTYKCQIISTGTEVFYTVSKQDGSVDKTVRIAEVASAKKIFMRLFDSNDYLSKLSWKNALTNYSDPTFDGVMVMLPMISGQSSYIRVPSDFNGESRKAVLLAHGYTTTGTSMFRDLAQPRGQNDFLVSNGFITAASDLHGNNWGNDNAVADLKNLYDYLLALFNIETKVCMLAVSMGGLSTLRFIDQYPHLSRAWVGSAPSSDLVYSYLRSDFTTSCQTAWGTSDINVYGGLIKDKNPITHFAGLVEVPLKAWHSPDDALVWYAFSQNLVDSVNGYGGNATLYDTTGGHGGAAIDETIMLDLFNNPPVMAEYAEDTNNLRELRLKFFN